MRASRLRTMRSGLEWGFLNPCWGSGSQRLVNVYVSKPPGGQANARAFPTAATGHYCMHSHDNDQHHMCCNIWYIEKPPVQSNAR